MCLPVSPQFVQFEQSDMVTILNRHNYWRANVNPRPRSPLPALRWDRDLARTAAGWAAQCNMGHDEGSNRALPNRGPNGPAWQWVGQNICYSWGYSQSWTECIDNWADERKDWAYGRGQVGNGQIGHYTQLIWQDTLFVGYDFQLFFS